MTSKLALIVSLGVAVAAAGCSKAGGTRCSTGIYCPAGTQCAAKQAICIETPCGNGVIDPGEVCDDGGTIDGDVLDGKRCSADCKSDESCGNGIWDQKAGEACDKNDPAWAGHCSDDCKSTLSCGNHQVDPGEDCDEGPADDGQPGHSKETEFCNDDCTWSRCGDGRVNEVALEQCDRNGDKVEGTSGQSATCNPDCTLSKCGDEFINNDAGEQCDRGPGNNRDSGECTSECKANRCGDGHPWDGHEECDEGDANNSDTGACLTTCKVAKCGDGQTRDLVETCDEGPLSAKEVKACSYGLVNCEVCSKCQKISLTDGPRCGDKTKQTPYEQCDDGPDNGRTICDYGATNCSYCNATCSAKVTGTPQYCGDGHTQGDEECDDGALSTSAERPCPYNQKDCVVCANGCKWTPSHGPYCGDGPEEKNVTNGEACDDGPNNGRSTCDYGSMSCSYCNATCSAKVAGSIQYCGDMHTQGPEECDEGATPPLACDYGTPTCTGCTPAKADGTGCKKTALKGLYCGDGKVNGPSHLEECDASASFSCQTCGQPESTTNPCRTVPVAKANGSIEVVSTDLLGATLTLIDDESQEELVFEFVNGNAARTGNTAVSIAGGTDGSVADKETIARNLKEAIGTRTRKLKATNSAGSSVVMLERAKAGVSGNGPITFTPGADAQEDAIKTEPLASGTGCRGGMSCARGEDCLSKFCGQWTWNGVGWVGVCSPDP